MLVHIILLYLCTGHHVLQIHADGDHGEWALIETQAGSKYIAKMATDVQHSSGKGNLIYNCNHSHT